MDTPKNKIPYLNSSIYSWNVLPVSRYSVVLKRIGSQSSTIFCMAFSREYSCISGSMGVGEREKGVTYLTGTSTDGLHFFEAR